MAFCVRAGNTPGARNGNQNSRWVTFAVCQNRMMTSILPVHENNVVSLIVHRRKQRTRYIVLPSSRRNVANQAHADRGRNRNQYPGSKCTFETRHALHPPGRLQWKGKNAVFFALRRSTRHYRMEAKRYEGAKSLSFKQEAVFKRVSDQGIFGTTFVMTSLLHLWMRLKSIDS